MFKIVFLFTFTFTAFSQITCDKKESKISFDNEFIKHVYDCSTKKESQGSIGEYCKCNDIVQDSETTLKKYKYDPTVAKDNHNQFIAKEFQKNMTKAMYSISNDLNILDGKLSFDEEFDLFNSCNINKLDEITQECGQKENSFLSLLGVDEIKKLKVQFKTELSKRQQPHINTGNSCYEVSKGYVDRCSSKYKSSCNMSDNVADAIFMDTSIRDLTRALIGFNKLNNSPLDKSDKFYNQLI